MKNILFILSVSILSLFSCRKDPKTDRYYGEVSAKKNGLDWEANPYAVRTKDGKIVFKFDVLSDEGYLRQEISIRSFDFAVKKYTTLGGLRDSLIRTTFNLLTSDGDVSEDFFDYEPDQDNFFSIDKIDTDKKTIKGSFKLKFKNDAGKIITFDNGVFNTKITLSL
jgi:hypothetical protein